MSTKVARPAMPLTDTEIERYARQIIVPGVGAGGQSALCASRVALAGETGGKRTVLTWLRALGCQVVRPDETPDCMIVAGADTVVPSVWRSLSRAGCPILWYALEGSRVRTGIVHAGGPPPVIAATQPEAREEDGASALRDIAACDIVASAAALILRWNDAEPFYEVDLA